MVNTNNDAPISVTGIYLRESPSGKAYLLLIEEPETQKDLGSFWLPKSVVKYPEGGTVYNVEYRKKITVTVPYWFVKKNPDLEHVLRDNILEQEEQIYEEYENLAEQKELDFNSY